MPSARHKSFEQVVLWARRRGRDPRGRQDLAERPDRAAEIIADVRVVQRAAVIAHEVAHTVVLGRGVKNCAARGRGSRSRGPRRRGGRGRARRRPGKPCDVVDAGAVSRFSMTPCACCTMPTSSISVSRRSPRLGGCRSPTPDDGAARELGCLLEHDGRRFGDRRPRERRAAHAAVRAAPKRPPPDARRSRTRPRWQAAGSSNGDDATCAEVSMSSAYQYGVETMPHPAASAKVSAPEAICSRLRYGVTKTSVAASSSATTRRVRRPVPRDRRTVRPAGRDRRLRDAVPQPASRSPPARSPSRSPRGAASSRRRTGTPRTCSPRAQVASSPFDDPAALNPRPCATTSSHPEELASARLASAACRLFARVAVGRRSDGRRAPGGIRARAPPPSVGCRRPASVEPAHRPPAHADRRRGHRAARARSHPEPRQRLLRRRRRTACRRLARPRPPRRRAPLERDPLPRARISSRRGRGRRDAQLHGL